MENTIPEVAGEGRPAAEPQTRHDRPPMRQLGGEPAGSAVLAESVSFAHQKKQRKALDNVNISVQRGSIFALLGPSGCGKTTLLRCIVGCVKPEKGRIRIFGRCPGEGGFCIPGRGVGYMPQDLALYPEITIEEMLTYFAKLYRMNRKEISDRIAFLTALLDVPDKKTLIQNLSGGQKRRVSFAVALIHKPPLLMLDEPTVGVDPLLRQSIWDYMKDLAREQGMTIMITTHYVEEARQANMVGLMRDGRMLVQMDPEVLIQRYEATTLEQVFLKICRNATPKREPAENDVSRIDTSETPKPKQWDVQNSDVWIRLEDVEDEKRELMDDAVGFLSNGGGGGAEMARLPQDATSYLRRIDESFHRLVTLTGKNFVRLKRNIPLIVFEIFVPVIQVVVFCLCIGGEPFDLPLAVVNRESDPTAFGQKFLNSLSNKTFLQERYEDIGPAVRSVEVGDTWGVIHIGPSFTESLIDRYLDGATASNETIMASEIHLYLDMTNQQIATTVYASVMRGFEQFSKELLIEFGYNPRLADPPIVLKKPIYGSLDSLFSEFMVPGMIIGITYMMTIGLTAMSLIIEKKDGLLERFLVAGVTSVEVVCSILLHLFVSMVFQVAIVLLITFLLFRIPILGSVFWVVFCVLLVGLSGMTYGLLVSTICRDENAAMMVSMGSFYPNFLLSGVIWPIEAMPRYLRYFSYALPMTQITRTIRSILSKGWHILDYGIWDGPLINFSWSLLLIIISCIVFKYKKN